jgi:hypothetical protein
MAVKIPSFCGTQFPARHFARSSGREIPRSLSRISCRWKAAGDDVSNRDSPHRTEPRPIFDLNTDFAGREMSAAEPLEDRGHGGGPSAGFGPLGLGKSLNGSIPQGVALGFRVWPLRDRCPLQSPTGRTPHSIPWRSSIKRSSQRDMKNGNNSSKERIAAPPRTTERCNPFLHPMFSQD